ncbi:MAG TPA: hypothetical protein VGD74_06095 [Vulgatibacter sp.]
MEQRWLRTCAPSAVSHAWMREAQNGDDHMLLEVGVQDEPGWVPAAEKEPGAFRVTRVHMKDTTKKGAYHA